MTFKEGEGKEKRGRKGEGENGETSYLGEELFKVFYLFLQCF